MRYLTRTIWILSIISLLTDVASEMLYPVMPIYLKRIGFSVMLIGILEGIAEATAGLSKGYFGKLSDHWAKRVPFVRLGYALSAISKPMLAVTTYPLWIFFARTIDRLGKGIRTGARDAMLSEETTAQSKGRVFGFHRSLDTMGAVLGPAMALLYLYFYPGAYQTLFLLAFIPGLLSIGLSFLLKDKNFRGTLTKKGVGLFSFLKYWKNSPPEYRRLVAGLLAFALFNSSDVFLLLKVKQAGISDTLAIGIYVFYNFIYAVAAFPFGILADKIGLRKIFIVGLVFFVIVYAGISIQGSWAFYGIIFSIYGLYAAATEGITKAWISNIVNKSDTATAIGTYTGLQSICTFLASSMTGWIWYTFGASSAFFITAIATTLILIYFLILHLPEK